MISRELIDKFKLKLTCRNKFMADNNFINYEIPDYPFLEISQTDHVNGENLRYKDDLAIYAKYWNTSLQYYISNRMLLEGCKKSILKLFFDIEMKVRALHNSRFNNDVCSPYSNINSHKPRQGNDGIKCFSN